MTINESRSSDDNTSSDEAVEHTTTSKPPTGALKAVRKQLSEQLAQRSVGLVPALSSDLAFTRNQLRNAYLRLIFHAPLSKAAHNVELAMWTETTHRFVGLYRSKLSKLEAEMKGAASSNPSDNGVSPSHGSKSSKTSSNKQSSEVSTGPKKKAQVQEYTRMAEALRQFLAKEEAFWKGLAERMAAVFRLEDAQPALEKAGIVVTGPRIPLGPKSVVGAESQPTGLARLPSSPAELDPSVLQTVSLPRHKEKLLGVVHRILVYCGDLTRYKELYRDSSKGQQAASSNSSATVGKHGNGSRGGNPKRPSTPSTVATSSSAGRDFSSSTACYEAAKLLIPSNGNPSNQLAVVATYQNDTLGAVYQYYRALCVKVPFETAKVNLGAALGKALSQWVKEGKDKEADGDTPGGGAVSEHRRRQACLREFVVLHALFFAQKDFSSIVKLSARFTKSFEAVVAERYLTTDTIVRIMVTSIAASWTARLWRKGANSSDKATDGAIKSESSPSLHVELQLLDHVLSLSRVLFKIAASQTRQALEDAKVRAPSAPASMRPTNNGESDGAAAKNITAVMRRIIPALRIASKWMKAHLDFIERCQTLCITRAAEGMPASAEGSEDESRALAAADLNLIQSVEDFWTSFVDLINTLRYAFPFDSLPSLGGVGPMGAAALALEEDVDLRGFIPTRRGMLTQDDAAYKPAYRQLHPNEEQLMRIADLLVDAKVVAESQASPIVFDDHRAVFKMDSSSKGGLGSSMGQMSIPSGLQVDASAGLSRPANLRGDHERRYSMSSESIGTSEATDDVVEMAMRAGAGRQGPIDSDEEDEIYIPSMPKQQRQLSQPPRPYSSFDGSNNNSAQPSFDVGSMSQALSAAPLPRANESLAPLPFGAYPSSAPAAVLPQQGNSSATAQDILLNMLNGHKGFVDPVGPSAGMATPPYRSSPSTGFGFGQYGQSSFSPRAPHDQLYQQSQQQPLGSPYNQSQLGGCGLPSPAGAFAGGQTPRLTSSVGQQQQPLSNLASIWNPSPGEARQLSSSGAGIGSGLQSAGIWGEDRNSPLQQQQQQPPQFPIGTPQSRQGGPMGATSQDWPASNR